MEPDQPQSTPKPSSLRWQILRRALLRRPSNSDNPSEKVSLDKVSRRTKSGFNLIPCHVVNDGNEDPESLARRDICFYYTLPLPNAPKLCLRQRWEDCVDLNDFEVCNQYDIDNTGLVLMSKLLGVIYIGQTYVPKMNIRESLENHEYNDSFLFREISSWRSMLPILTRGRRLLGLRHASLLVLNVLVSLLPLSLGMYFDTIQKSCTSTFQASDSCQWPSEDVLAYYSMSRLDFFRNKRVIELGSGYGLAGFVIAMVTEALEVVISDGNPQVVDYIQHNINSNSAALGSTKVKSMILHWDQHEVSDIYGTFDIIVASDCTFFKKFHKGLARTIRCLLKEHGPSEAILFSPKRGDSLDKFLVEVEASGLHFTITETYDAEIWRRHKNITNGDHSWPNYESDHCYPLLISITR